MTGMKKGIVLFTLIALSAALIVIGCIKGQPDSVMAKAVTVCLECIGIG